MPTLKETYNVLSEQGYIPKDIPGYIGNNLNPDFELREYQKEAIARFTHYMDQNQNRIKPSQLLFHMATGSGKTLLMAANILYLYDKGYRNFLFFVNSTNIIEKTRENFLNPDSSKYLFNEKIKFEDKEVKINEVDNFEAVPDDDINIVFTTVQGLYSDLKNLKENSLTLEDFKDKKIVLISDEAHHINAWTKNKIGKEESIAKTTWEYTVSNIFNSNTENIMMEYTATVDLETPSIFEKYQDKIIYEYGLKQFRQEGYSKDVKVLQADLDNIDRMLQAMTLSQYRRKISEKYKTKPKTIKPVILMKSKTIKESEKNYLEFLEKINGLTIKDIQRIKTPAKGNVLENAFKYFEKEGITFENLITELKEDFSEEKCMLLDSNNINEEKQLKLNSLEDHNNEVRAIFAVDMLNEGWDVLNLFDIVRLYDTRDAKSNKPGPTTIREAQLIGRGARYFPFKLKEEDEKFKRKFDQEPENDLKVIEELYYHSKDNVRYIQELKTALRDAGIMPPQEPKTIHLKVKDKIKETDFWKNGFIFVNERFERDRSKIKDINDIDVSKSFGPYPLKTGFTQDRAIFVEELKAEEDKTTRQFELKTFNETIIRKAISKIDFYKFDNLQKYFPKLNSMNEFTESLKQVKLDIRSSKKRLSNLTPDDKLEVCLYVLKQLETQIRAGYTKYGGRKLFVQNKIEEFVRDKTLNINVGDYGGQEYGEPMSNPKHENLRLNLSVKDWYVYDENYGTSDEKHFIQFINGEMETLEEKYSEIYLLRNANLFSIYRFSDGRPTEPDFVLFLKEKDKEKWIQYQLFIEAKGTHLLKTDQWKEDFLKEIEDNHELQILAENEKYKLMGMPFYNEDTKTNFIDVFNDKLSLN
ncbi:MAG: type III deoxyribonuclease [Candidatus Altiarchaeales archaeon WOR_SM1_79]|nr:MAG: type III deoxyribonuclease [Candidatus Altiarchaeales archaeon WOR_SM1_79]